MIKINRTLVAVAALVTILVVAGGAYYILTMPSPTELPNVVYLAYDFAPCEAYQFLAIEDGYFEAEGLTDMEFKIFPVESAAELREVIHTGEVWVGPCAMEFLPAVDQEADYVYTNGLHMGCIMATVSNQLYDAGVVDEATFIDWIEEGLDAGEKRSIAISHYGNSPTWLLGATLSRHGLSFGDINMVVMDIAAVPAAMKAGQIDVSFEWDPIPTIIEQEGIGHIFLDNAADAPWNNMYCCFIGVNKGALDKHPETMKSIVTALHKAALATDADPVHAAEVMHGFGAELVPYTLDELVTAVSHYKYDVPSDITMEKATLKLYGDLLYDLGEITHDGDWVVANGYEHIDLD